MKPYLELVKIGIVKMVAITGALGYALGFPFEMSFSLIHFLIFLLGLSFISSGSLALNSYQEWEIDSKMPRTSKRPIPLGLIQPSHAVLISLLLIVLGASFLYYLEPIASYLGLLTVFLYNIVYTMLLKRSSAFAAVPGAIPGAMPVTIGYSVVNTDIFSTESLYVFTLMFLWQMPHFWSLAIRYKKDYEEGGIPVLPVALGTQRTLYHMGLYIFPYIALALMSPWFVVTSWFYFLLVIPLALISMLEFYKFLQSGGSKNWVRFFVWINISMIGFLLAPVLDRWFLYVAKGVLRQ